MSLPARAGAGTTVLLRAPVGSQVDAFGGSHRVPASGQLALTVPDDVEGRVPVRVQRPAGPALVLQLHVTPPVP
ncbi:MULTISPECIES: hypothetical protein [Luteimonas]|uniref:hypothetical protein n=1 Tax=Luteimonas TaxID=83614 RepID=UPI00117DD95B|nr:MULTISPECIES: hypothetical protein [Luteimonas]